MDFDTNDCWTLLSICANGKEGGDLRGIIWLADYINHDIPNYDELFASMRKLHKAGLIIQKDDKFRRSRGMAMVYAKIRKANRAYLKQWDDIKAYLERYKVPKKGPGTRLRGLTKRAFKKALKDYYNRR